MTKDEIDAVLNSWNNLCKATATMTEDDCRLAIERELVGNRRGYVVVRIHQVYNKLRVNRERAEFAAKLADIPAFMVK